MNFHQDFLFVICGTLSAYLISLGNDYVFVYFAGVIYGLATVLFLPALKSAEVSLTRNVLLRLLWIAGAAASYYLAVQTFMYFSSMIGSDGNMFGLIVAGVVGASVVSVVYGYIAYSVGHALRGGIIFLLPLVGGILPALIYYSFSEPFPVLHYVWQAIVSVMLILVMKNNSRTYI